MMESLRNFLTGPRLAVIIALLALPFVFLGTSSLGTVFNGSLGSINGEEVSELDYTVAANIRANKLKEIYGDEFNFNELDDQVQVDLIKQELISQKVFLSEVRGLGLLNEEEIRSAKKSIIQDPLYRDEFGNFDEIIFESFANQNGFSKSDYIDLMSKMNATEMYRFSLSSALFQLPNEVANLVNILEKKAAIDFIKIDLQELKNTIKNTLTDQVDFYNQNKEIFYSQEERVFDYFVLSSDDYIDKVSIPEDYASNYYDNYVTKAESNIQKRISHIMVDKSNYESTDEALNKIQTVSNLLSTGSLFNDLVSEYSEDIVTKNNEGDLDFFDSEVFPEEFTSSVEEMNLDDVSGIIELDSTFHILKVTEVAKEEIRSFDEVSFDVVNELVSSESIALLNDDYNELDQLSLEGQSISDLANFAGKDIISSSPQSFASFDPEFVDSIKDIIFDDFTELNEPKLVDLDGMVYVVSLSQIKEPELKPFDLVQEDVNRSLIDINASIMKSELEKEYSNLTTEDDKQKFIDGNSYISSDAFKDIKRYSSLLPQEILRQLFESIPGSEMSLSSNNGDHYFITLNGYSEPTELEKKDVLEQYSPFNTERLADRMNDIMNDDLFNKAVIKLNEQVFNLE